MGVRFGSMSSIWCWAKKPVCSFRCAHRAARHRLQPAGEELGERRLAVAVRTQQADAVFRIETQVDARQDRLAGLVADRDAVERHHRWLGQLDVGEFEAHGVLVALDHDGRELGERLQARLGLRGLRCLGTEAIDEGLHVLALGIDLRGHRGLQGQALLAQDLEAVVVAAVDRELFLVEMKDVRAHGVEQPAVVADDQQRARPALQIVLEPQRALEVEMVRRFVEQQDVGPREQDAGERHAHAPAAGEFRQRTVLHFGVEAEAGEDRGGPRDGRIGIDLGKPHVYVGDPRAVGRRFLLGEQGGTLLVGGEHGFERGRRPAGCFLRHESDARAPGHGNAALVGVEPAEDGVQQRGFSGAVPADKADAAAFRNEGGGVLDQGQAADPQGQIVYSDHGASL